LDVRVNSFFGARELHCCPPENRHQLVGATVSRLETGEKVRLSGRTNQKTVGCVEIRERARHKRYRGDFVAHPREENASRRR
jgi:hypothetical protein